MGGLGVAATLFFSKLVSSQFQEQQVAQQPQQVAPQITPEQIYLTSKITEAADKQAAITEQNALMAQGIHQALYNAQSQRERDIGEFQQLLSSGLEEEKKLVKEYSQAVNPMGEDVEQLRQQADVETKAYYKGKQEAIEDLQLEAAAGTLMTAEMAGVGLTYAGTKAGIAGAAAGSGGLLGLGGLGFGWVLHKTLGNVGGGYDPKSGETLTWFEKNVLGGPSPIHGWLGAIG